eukprot:5129794-Amphidinium_carterae.1
MVNAERQPNTKSTTSDPSQTATTTIMTQPNQQQPPSITLYDQQQYVRAFTGGAILVVDKDNTTTDQLQRWAILIDTGAITSVASKHHFSHIPIIQLRHRDPQLRTYSSHRREH